jgi:hypothetical protein
VVVVVVVVAVVVVGRKVGRKKRMMMMMVVVVEKRKERRRICCRLGGQVTAPREWGRKERRQQGRTEGQFGGVARRGTAQSRKRC